MNCVIVWFRRDLRLTDHPALHRALRSGAAVIPLYIHAPEEEAPWMPGGAGRWWLHHSLDALDRSLRLLGSRLVLRRGPSLETLQHLITETGAQQVFWNRLYDPALIARDIQIKEMLQNAAVECHSHSGNLLCEPWTIKTQSGGPYRVFTPFWRVCERQGLDSTVLPAPAALPTPPTPPSTLALTDLDLLPAHPWTQGLRASWTVGEAAAWKRLETFTENTLANYPQTRDQPDTIGTSRLSPHLHFGELSPRQIVAALHDATQQGAAGAQRGAETMLRELGWREFAHHVLYHYPHTPDTPLDARYNGFPWREHAVPLLHAWQRGQTGIPLVDAGMRELWHTGWMHNRVRMITASYLTKHLRVPWQDGARWFWDTLVDADLANNTLNWQWCAGCGADASPYFRIFNPVLQGKKFDPQGRYIRRWVPELARLPDRFLHAPWTAPVHVQRECSVVIGRDYPDPIVDLQQGREEALAVYQRFVKG